MPKFEWSKAGKLVITIVLVDLFCGAGGLSEAARRAIDRLQSEHPKAEVKVIHYAVNCWDVAIRSHELNHPGAIRVCQRVEFLKPFQLVKEGWIDLLTAGVECIYHSLARGDRPINDQRRSTAWAVPDWLQLPTGAFVLECVKEIRDWGPVDINGKKIKHLKGNIYRAWIEAIRANGFGSAEEILCCADFGDATTRERWFSLGRSDGRSITFPSQSHGSPTHIAGLKTEKTLFELGELQPWRTARQIIDWSIKGKSIFRRSKRNADNTLIRAEVGLTKFNDSRAAPWVAAIKHFRGQLSATEPTVIDFKGEVAEVVPIMVGLRNHMDGLNVDAPVPTICASGKHFMLAEPVVFNIDQKGAVSVPARSVDSPIATVTTKARVAVVEPEASILKYYGTADAQSVDDPLATVTTRDRFAMANPVILPHPRSSEPEKADSIDKPLRTITASSNDFALAEPVIIGQGGPEYAGKPKSIDEPLTTVMCDSHSAIVRPVLVNLKGQSTATDIDEPVPTQTTEHHFYVAQGFLLPHRKFKRMDVDSLDRPIRTIDATNADQIGVVNPTLVPNFGEREGQSPRCHSVDDPLPVITAQHGAPSLVQGYIIDVNHGIRDGESQGRRAQSLDEPLGTITAARRGKALVELEGETVEALGPMILLPILVGHGKSDGKPQYRYFLMDAGGAWSLELDLTLRMLQWHELAAATSLEDYHLAGTSSDKTRQIGNAVPRRTGEALCYVQMAPIFEEAERLINERPEVALAA